MRADENLRLAQKTNQGHPGGPPHAPDDHPEFLEGKRSAQAMLAQIDATVAEGRLPGYLYEPDQK
jgi:hypothetical protein